LFFGDQHFQIETREAGGFFWSLDDTSLIVWDSCLEYRIFRYALDGKLLGRYSAYENNALGIKAVCRSRAGIIAVGSYDQKVDLAMVLGVDSLLKQRGRFDFLTREGSK
jgi:hypothetical protein